MAMVDRIITLPELGVPAIMPSFRRIAPELATPVFEDKIYIAAGKDVKEGKAKIVWTVHQSGGNVKICIIHVLVPSQTIPMRGLGAGMPANSANEIMLKEHRENERTNMHKILDTYLRVCEQMGVPAEKEYIESDNIQKGIVELIRLHGIKKLVMGAAADRRYSKKMTEIKSKKAIFIREKADISCQIRFICDGNLIHARSSSDYFTRKFVSFEIIECAHEGVVKKRSTTNNQFEKQISRISCCKVECHRIPRSLVWDDAETNNCIHGVLFGQEIVISHGVLSRGWILLLEIKPNLSILVFL
ncbi:U-box domain-containing protein 33-like [Syzygium oleosum]|uniref:U-box domain-containing protein 33-like n=1 Tax=Syzygium oleosum TaxID=219896 RepID=UPI0024BA31B4|nr:U-box domain-containing protein 33-like [Syzygium oleosum]